MNSINQKLLNWFFKKWTCSLVIKEFVFSLKYNFNRCDYLSKPSLYCHYRQVRIIESSLKSSRSSFQYLIASVYFAFVQEFYSFLLIKVLTVLHMNTDRYMLTAIGTVNSYWCYKSIVTVLCVLYICLNKWKQLRQGKQLIIFEKMSINVSLMSI